MRNYALLFLLLTAFTVQAQQFKLNSPDNYIQLGVNLSASGEVSYTVTYKNKPVVLPSPLGMKLKEPAVNLNRFSLVKADSSVYDQTASFGNSVKHNARVIAE